MDDIMFYSQYTTALDIYWLCPSSQARTKNKETILDFQLGALLERHVFRKVSASSFLYSVA